jgi:beta-lactamase regulating signal transducer with metallopeptidase domain
MSGSWETAVAKLVIELAIKSALLLSAVLATLWFLRRTSAAMRHLGLTVMVIALLVLPAATLLLPFWSLDLLDAPADIGRPVAIEDVAFDRPSTAASVPEAVSGAGPTPRHEVAAAPRWPRWLAFLWGGGTAFLLAGLVFGKLHGAWTARRAAPVRSGPVLAALSDIAGRTGLDRAPEVRESERIKVPTIVGILTPRLLLPPSAGRWPEDRWRAILHHELAHVRRRDILVQFLAQVTCCLYWPNPLVWLLERRLFIERERACDDVALNAEIRASDYAGHLMEVLEEMGDMKRTTWITAAMAEGTDFRDRILSVLNPVTPRTTPRRSQMLMVAALALVLVLPLSALNPWSTAKAARTGSPLNELDFLSIGSGDASEVAAGRESADERSSATAHPDRDSTTRVRDRDSRMRDTDSLAGRGDGIPFTVLLEMLQDADPYLRKLAAFELGNRGDRRSVQALVPVLRDEDVFVREHVATALGKLGDARAVPALIPVLRDEDGVVREHVATALGTLGDERAVPALIAALRDEDAFVREHVATALGKLGDARAVPALVAALEDEDDVVREHVASALRKLGGRGRRHRDRD